MKRATARFRQQLVLLAALCLALVWIAAAYEILRSHQVYIHDSEVRTSVQAHVFAEYSRSTIKRINEFMLDVRSRWNGDWQAFSELVLKTQENIDDLTFQVAVIDKDGILAFSNLAKPTDRTDLSGRDPLGLLRQRGRGRDGGSGGNALSREGMAPLVLRYQASEGNFIGRPYYLLAPFFGFKLVRRPLSVPAASSMTALISAGLPARIASVNAVVSSAGMVT